METPTHLAQLLRESARQNPDKGALCHKDPSLGKWSCRSWSQVWTDTLKLTCLLEEMGIGAGDRVAIWSENRPEWLLADMAVYCLDGITVPIYVTLAELEIDHILKDSQSRVLAVSSAEILSRLDSSLHELRSLEQILLFDGDYTIANSKWSGKLIRLKDRLRDLEPESEKKIEKRIAGDHRDQLATIIYTSGTTGLPKGVMLTHGNFIANCLAVLDAIPIRHQDIHLSFLPLSHVFERLCGQYLLIKTAATTYYAENIDSVPQNLAEVRPTILLGVPRFYEKMRNRIEEKIRSASALRRRLFSWAQHCGTRISHIKEERRKVPILLKLQGILADLLVFRKVKAALGGRVRFCVSGGAPLREDLARFFHSLGVLIIEGYGLTETAPVITANRLEAYKFGTVGQPLEGIQVCIDPDGEIVTKSNCIMKGYFNLEHETQDAIRDGWFHTGDLGSLDPEGFLRITGRKKEILVTSGGKKICPETVEALFEKEAIIEHCLLYGEGKNFLTALIIPDHELLKKMARRKNFHYASLSDLVKAEWVRQLVESAIHRVHEKLAPFEQVKYFHLLERDFSLREGELTPTLKPRRNVIHRKFGHLLERFYEASPPT